MKIINLPTSITEVKELWNTHKSKRTRNNRDVIRELKRDVYNVLNDGYWKGDISEYFRDNIDNRGDKHLKDPFDKAFRNLK